MILASVTASSNRRIDPKYPLTFPPFKLLSSHDKDSIIGEITRVLLVQVRRIGDFVESLKECDYGVRSGERGRYGVLRG